MLTINAKHDFLDLCNFFWVKGGTFSNEIVIGQKRMRRVSSQRFYYQSTMYHAIN